MILSSLFAFFSKSSFKCSLENYISSRMPKSIYDVERMTKEYFQKENAKCW